MHRSPSTPDTTTLEELGLYNLLNQVARGQSDIDAFLLASAREKGFVDFGAIDLTPLGTEQLRDLTVRLGWFYPDE